MESWDSRVSILGPQQRIFVCGENLFLAIWGRGGSWVGGSGCHNCTFIYLECVQLWVPDDL